MTIKNLSAGEKYLLQQLVLELMEEEVPFMVITYPSFLVEGVPHIVRAKKLPGRCWSDIVGEVVEMGKERANNSQILVLHSVYGEQLTVSEHGHTIEVGYVIRYAWIDMEKKREN